MTQALRRQGVEVLADTTVAEVLEYRPDGVLARLSDGSERAAARVRRGGAGAEHGRRRPGGARHPHRARPHRGRRPPAHRVGDVFAVGDAIPGPQLAHLGQAEGANAVETALDGPRVLDRSMVPSCVYTPEIARVGLTEEGAREAGLDVTVGTGRLGANGKALAMGETLGSAWWSTAPRTASSARRSWGRTPPTSSTSSVGAFVRYLRPRGRADDPRPPNGR